MLITNKSKEQITSKTTRVNTKSMNQNWIYNFYQNEADGESSLRNLLGGKGANLAQMCRLKLPVPPGFTISTEVCDYFYKNNKQLPEILDEKVRASIAILEKNLNLGFGDIKNPLLVSVRSGARVSMPGMLDTVLNLGLNRKIAKNFAKISGNARFVYDSYRRFIQMYSDVVLGIDNYFFERILDQAKMDLNLTRDSEISALKLEEIIDKYHQVVLEETGEEFPQDPYSQLFRAIESVFLSWHTQRAKMYRTIHSIPESWGTAVNVQSMVFGNMGNDCATGVMFTRNPSDGENKLYGEYLVNAQGEDVVAGIRTPHHILASDDDSDTDSLEKLFPDCFSELCKYRNLLEKYYKDMQDIEFTIQNNRLFILQTRSGKRTAKSAIKIALDLFDEGIISESEALQKVDPLSLDQILHPSIDEKAKKKLVATGLPASPGAAYGILTFSAQRAEALAADGNDVILARIETSPEDIHGMHAAKGIITQRGGMTSHAAVVARGMGKACIAGVSDMVIDYESKSLTINDKIKYNELDWLTIDGTTGCVYQGKVETKIPDLSPDFVRLMEIADKHSKLKVRANADTPSDAKTALSLGAKGIGLCRTEHMFFSDDRIFQMRKMIFAISAEERAETLAEIFPMQKQDFKDIFREMSPHPVTIRLLDPPLHEFLPKKKQEIEAFAKLLKKDYTAIQKRLFQLEEANPMLGHRGARLLISHPEICQMQARAIFEALVENIKEADIKNEVEIMIPLVASKNEFDYLKKIITKVAKEVVADTDCDFLYSVGTMIELPRACLLADEIAKTADFFSFGTNDLTQTVWGMSRDDATPFLKLYEQRKLISTDPFSSLDQEGVGQLIKTAIKLGLQTNKQLKLGICGEHGGDPTSIEFFNRVGLEYVSCSPYRVPIARLSAALAKINVDAFIKEN